MKMKIAALVVSSLLYIFPAYVFNRSDFGWLFAVFAVQFFLYLYIIRNLNFSASKIILWCLIPRIVWIAATPALSDDFHRFYWDGTLILNGIDPYAKTPEQLHKSGYTEESAENKIVYRALNSRHYYSVYPPVNQLFFVAGAMTGSETGFIILTRLTLIGTDLLLLVLIYRILQQRKSENAIPETRMNALAVYAFNPLVITEITGNLHFEGISMLFWLMAVYMLLEKRTGYAIIAWIMAAGTKLVPLILTASVWPGRKTRFSALLFMSVFCGGAGLIYAMSGNTGIQHFFTSVDLYFRKFEFNGSLYFLAREIGTYITGYNPIRITGPLMSVVFMLSSGFLLYKSIRNKTHDLFVTSTLLLTMYYLCSTTVHPWYIINILVPAALCGLRYPVMWTGLVFLSYGLYTADDFYIRTVLISAEYLALFFLLFKESRFRQHAY